MRGEHNHSLLEHAVFLGPGTTAPRFTLVSMGPYPAALAGGSTAIAGEVYLVDDATLALLDQLEGCPHLYQREQTTIDDTCRAEIYMMPRTRAQHATMIQTGDWRQR
jgi:gamma-glutamylcyclotransferase (GGCT)/AIG2-like uncharacterized protein YtfP